MMRWVKWWNAMEEKGDRDRESTQLLIHFAIGNRSLAKSYLGSLARRCRRS